MDMEFEKVRNLIPQVNISISIMNEDVAEVERRIWTVKECCRGIMATLPFSFLPQKFIVNLVQFITMWSNAFPNKTGILSR